MEPPDLAVKEARHCCVTKRPAEEAMGDVRTMGRRELLCDTKSWGAVEKVRLREGLRGGGRGG